MAGAGPRKWHVLAPRLTSVERTLQKASIIAQYGKELNGRQTKALDRLFEAEPPEGFVGGMSAGKYVGITKAIRATATRDLQKPVDLGILRKTGERRYARYWLRGIGSEKSGAERQRRAA